MERTSYSCFILISLYKSEAEEVGQTVVGQVIFSVFYTGTPWPVPGLENTQEYTGQRSYSSPIPQAPWGQKLHFTNFEFTGHKIVTDSEEELNKFVDNKTVNKSHPIAEIDNIF